MKPQHTLVFRINTLICALFLCCTVNSQNDSIVNIKNDSTKIKQKYGLRIGGDIGKLIRTSIDENYSGFEIMADFRLKKKIYLAGEIGFEEKNTTNDFLNITTNGSYLKAGIDFNMYENWLDMDNMVYAGFRLGASRFNHDLNSFTVYNINQYWAPQLTSNETQQYKSLNAFWGEVILGVKAEILKNLYMGINMQLKLSVSQTTPDNFDNVYIPGFGKTYDSSIIGAGYSYFIAYRIPFYKK